MVDCRFREEKERNGADEDRTGVDSERSRFEKLVDRFR